MQPVTAEIDRTGDTAAHVGDLGDQAVADDQRAIDDRFRGHDPGVGEHELIGHAATFAADGSSTPLADGTTDNPIVAIATTTTARFAASKDAVGSSSNSTGWAGAKPRATLTRCGSRPGMVAGGSTGSRFNHSGWPLTVGRPSWFTAIETMDCMHDYYC